MDWQVPVASLPALLAAALMGALIIVLLRAGRGRRAALALAPLQRAAERLAEKAVPRTAPAHLQIAARGEHSREAVRQPLRGGSLARADELKLARLAEAMGIGAGEPLSIIHEAERERAGSEWAREAAA